MTKTVEMIATRGISFNICVMMTLSIAGCAARIFSIRYTIQGIPFRTENGASMDECLRRCKLRPSCKSVVYKRGPHHCSLYEHTANIGLLNENPGEYYAEPSWRYGQDGIGGCTHTPCGVGLSCRPNGGCFKSECIPPSARNYTIIDGNIFNIGAKLKHRCVSPFLDPDFDVSEVSLCQDNGDWTNLSLICDCGTPLQIQNATAEKDDVTPLGGAVKYNCNFGYTYSSTLNSLTCLLDGKWSTPMFNCVPIDCGVYKTINNSYTITTGGTTFGHQVEYVCINGTISNNGSNIAVCSGLGNWTPFVTLACSLVSCGQPKIISNTILTGTLTTFGSVVKYSCIDGYENTANSSAEANSSCKASGDWTDILFACEPASPNGFTLYQTDAFLLQQQIVITTYGEAILVGLTLHECADKCRNETRFCIAISYIASNKTCVLVDRLKTPFASTGWTIWSKDIGIYYSYGRNGRYTLTFTQSKNFCMSQGTDIASKHDIQHAYDLGFNVNQCGWISDETAVIVLHYPDPGHFDSVGINTCTWGNKWGVFCLEKSNAM